MVMLKSAPIPHGGGVQLPAAISRIALAPAYIMFSGLTVSQSGPGGPVGTISYMYEYAMLLQQHEQ